MKKEIFEKIINNIDYYKLQQATDIVKINLEKSLPEHEFNALILFAYHLPFKAQKFIQNVINAGKDITIVISEWMHHETEIHRTAREREVKLFLTGIY